MSDEKPEKSTEKGELPEGSAKNGAEVVALDPFGDVGVAIVARLLNLTPTRVSQLAKEGVIPRAGRGRYNVAGSVRGYIAFLQKRGEIGPDTDPDSMEPFRRKAHYQAESDKLKLGQAQGALIPVDEVEDEMSAVAKIVTEMLETLPDILERDTGATPRQIAMTERAIDRVREAIYSKVRKRGGGKARASA